MKKIESFIERFKDNTKYKFIQPQINFNGNNEITEDVQEQLQLWLNDGNLLENYRFLFNDINNIFNEEQNEANDIPLVDFDDDNDGQSSDDSNNANEGNSNSYNEGNQ